MQPQKTFCLVEIIKVKKKQGVMQTTIIWTFQDDGRETEVRGSIAPPRLLNRRNLSQLVDWALARHRRAWRRTQGARTRRSEGGARRGIEDAINLHAAEKIRKKLSHEED